MPKNFLFAVLFLLLHLSGEAWGNSFIMDRARWAHASETEKEKLLIKTMEFVVELESKYKYEVQTSGFNWDRYRRYTQMVEDIHAFLVAEAHAQGETSAIQSHFQTFVGSLGRMDRNHCIYGGWISRMGPYNRCVHPDRQHRTSGYPARSNCRGPDQISCNPAIFGFKHVDNKTLFCVSAGVKDSKNSSLECMQASLEETGDAERSTRAERLAHLRLSIDQLGADAKADYIANLHRYVVKLCACEHDNDRMNQSYVDRIRPHRTCLGLLNMVRETNHCVENDILDSTSAAPFTALSEYLSSTNGAEQIMGRSSREGLDGYYRGFLDSLGENEEVQRFCAGEPATPDDPAEPEVTCTAACVVNEADATKRDCTFRIMNGEDDITTATLGEGAQNPETLDLTAEKKVTVDGNEITCELSNQPPEDATPPADGAFACSLTTELIEGKVKFTLVTENLPEGATTADHAWPEGHEDFDTALLPMFATYALPAGETSLEKSVTIKVGETTHTCSGTYQAETPTPDDGDGNRSIEVTVHNSQVTSVRVTARIDESETGLGTGEKIVWIARRTTTITAPPATSTTGGAGDGTGEPPATPQPPTSSTSDTTISEGSSLEVIVEKENTPYQVCAHLKGEGTMLAEDCDTIPARTAPPAPAQGGGGGPQPFRPMPTPRIGTRADGIM